MEMGENGANEYTKDGTVDLHGNAILRSKRGGWTACSFIVGRLYLFSLTPLDLHLCVT